MTAPQTLEHVPDPDGLYRGDHTEPYRDSNVWRAHREEMIAEIPHVREKARKFGLTFDTPAPPPPATDPHEPKEPRRAPFVNGAVPMRWEFDTLLNDISASVGESEYPAARAALCRAYDALVAERDEWKRRAEAAEAAPEHWRTVQHNIQRADTAEAERDAALLAIVSCPACRKRTAAALEALGEGK